jgi:t-SNARE complex subunit (syntaxin)
MSGSYSTPYMSAGTGNNMPPPPAGRDLLQQQDQVIRQQDQSLDQLANSVATLHRMGNDINGELVAQGHLLDDLERGVDQTRGALDSQHSRLKKLMLKNKRNCSWMIMIVLLIVALCVILYFVLTSK